MKAIAFAQNINLEAESEVQAPSSRKFLAQPRQSTSEGGDEDIRCRSSSLQAPRRCNALHLVFAACTNPQFHTGISQGAMVCSEAARRRPCLSMQMHTWR
ncbi:hypothetical protein ABBQ38_011781 [Trebouxia sp. C0009 RCD-2024]